MDNEMPVGKLLEILTTFPPDSAVTLNGDYMQGATITVHPSDGRKSIDIWEV